MPAFTQQHVEPSPRQMTPPSLHVLICKMGPSIMGLCLPHSEDSKEMEAAILTVLHDCREVSGGGGVE